MIGGASLRRNVIANYASKLWSIASVYVFVPIYIKILGVESYGLIAFYSLALAVILIADAGLAASFTRETARQRDNNRLLSLLSSIERVLLFVLTVAGLMIFLGADMIASHWKSSGGALSADLTADCLRLMPLALVPQVAISLYFGGLMGMERQVKANALTILFGLVRSGIVVLPIYFFPDPRVFFAWQIAASWFFMFVMRFVLRRELASSTSYTNVLSWEELKPVLKYAVGMFAVSIIAGVNTLLDKAIVSFMRPLEEFAYYSIAGILAQIPLIVTTPVAVALLPRFTQLIELKQNFKLQSLYEYNSYLIASLSSALAFALIFFAKDLAFVWMPERTFPLNIFPVIQILSMGSLFLALQMMPFYLSLANGATKTNIRLGVGMMIFMVPLQYFLTLHFGLIGAATPWLLLNAFAFLFLGVVLNKKYNGGRIVMWFFRYSLLPLFISASTLFAARFITDFLGFRPLVGCMVAALFSLAALAIAYWLWPFVKPLDAKKL